MKYELKEVGTNHITKIVVLVTDLLYWIIEVYCRSYSSSGIDACCVEELIIESLLKTNNLGDRYYATRLELYFFVYPFIMRCPAFNVLP